MIFPLNQKRREWLKDFRIQAKLNTREIAEIFGISFQHYNDIETGRRNPSAKLSKEIARYFDFPEDKFLKNRTKFKKGDTQL